MPNWNITFSVFFEGRWNSGAAFRGGYSSFFPFPSMLFILLAARAVATIMAHVAAVSRKAVLKTAGQKERRHLNFLDLGLDYYLPSSLAWENKLYLLKATVISLNMMLELMPANIELSIYWCLFRF